jgi:hypothetical protein
LPDGKDLRVDLPHLINIGADAFIELRYFYERERSFFLIGDLPDSLRIVILERFPDWASRPPASPKKVG